MSRPYRAEEIRPHATPLAQQVLRNEFARRSKVQKSAREKRQYTLRARAEKLLTEEQIRDAFDLWEPYGMNFQDLAKKYKVHFATIARYIRQEEARQMGLAERYRAAAAASCLTAEIL